MVCSSRTRVHHQADACVGGSAAFLDNTRPALLDQRKPRSQGQIKRDGEWLKLADRVLGQWPCPLRQAPSASWLDVVPLVQGLWCIFELAAYREANPTGRIVLVPLYVEITVARPEKVGGCCGAFRSLSMEPGCLGTLHSSNWIGYIHRLLISGGCNDDT